MNATRLHWWCVNIGLGNKQPDAIQLFKKMLLVRRTIILKMFGKIDILSNEHFISLEKLWAQ